MIHQSTAPRPLSRTERFFTTGSPKTKATLQFGFFVAVLFLVAWKVPFLGALAMVTILFGAGVVARVYAGRRGDIENLHEVLEVYSGGFGAAAIPVQFLCLAIGLSYLW
ncbi:MAG: hypothetical protein KBD16_03720 [Candidatus Pacebacteria bacterium]|nr:hypothetical protein [Candidatus Paceibacterota bacterium]